MREKNFKIGQIHGKVKTQTGYCENEIRNQLFLIGKVHIQLKKNFAIYVRLVSYEFPLGHNRGKCIDLLGYDREFNPWIFELKKENTNDGVAKTIAQINGYAESFDKIKIHVAKEIEEAYLINGFKFSDRVKKCILIPNEYYIDRLAEIKSQKLDDLYFCSFARINIYDSKNKVDLISKSIGKGYISLKVINK
jgi:hypothetical protein